MTTNLERCVTTAPSRVCVTPRRRSQHYLIMALGSRGTQNPVKGIEGLAIPDAAVLDMDALHGDWYDWVLGRGPSLPCYRTASLTS